VAVEAVSAASVEVIYARFGIRSTGFCNFISVPRKNLRILPFFVYFLPANAHPAGGKSPISGVETE
jgi:hypothetical protein